jgi:clan AA aspartic protease (TIGR02281 family)
VRAVLFVLGVLVGAGVVWGVMHTPAPAGAGVEGAGTVDDGWARVARAPDDAGAWAQLADRQAAAGHVQRAARSFATAVALAPSDAELRARYGFVLYELGDDARALTQLKKARENGSRAAMLDFTVTTLGSELDETGPFPRFVDKGGAPKVAVATTTPRPAEVDAPVAPPVEELPPDDDNDDDDDDDDARDGAPAASEQEAHEEHGDDDEHEEEVEVDDPDPDSAASPEPEVDARGTPPVERTSGAAGRCALPLRSRGRHGTWLVDIVVGRQEASLVFDTGATLTVITRDYALAANIRIDDFNAITVRTANGTTRFSTAVIDELAIGDLVATDIRAAVCDDCGIPGMAGLLGLDVQRQLRLSLDVNEGVARYPCE